MIRRHQVYSNQKKIDDKKIGNKNPPNEIILDDFDDSPVVMCYRM